VPAARLQQLITDGFAALGQGRLKEAELKIREVLSADPNHVDALHGLALIAHQAAQYQPAIALFDRAIALRPDFAATHVNRGNSLYALQQFDTAIQSHREALRLQPGLNSALVNLASALQASGRIDEAVAALEQALAADPDSPQTWNNIGNLYKEQGRLQDAIDAYTRALRIDPMMQQAFSNRLAAQKLDDQRTPAMILDAHREWSAWFEGVASSAPVLSNDADADRPLTGQPLRIGYVSPDCHTALPAYIHPVLMAHDRSKFTIYCYFNNPQLKATVDLLDIAETARVIKGMTDEQVAQLIHHDQIDILIDIAGHTGHNRLGVFAWQMAPVQMTWLDYLSTTGVEAMDYRITDPVADPAGAEGAEEGHSESLLRMPRTQWCWRPPEDAPPVAPLPQLRNGHITFGSFNNAIKLTDVTLTLWRQLFEQMPTAHLLAGGIAEGFARERILRALGTSADRVKFLPRLSTDDYRRAFAGVDIALDPMPFSGATTTLDALWQGVPVLTLPGVTSCSRSSASLLTELGLEDWIACDADDWLARAQRHAGDGGSLSALRENLRAKVSASAIVDAKTFTRDLENLYLNAWAKWCRDRNDANAQFASRAAGDAIPFLATDEALKSAERLMAQSEAVAEGLDVASLDRATDLLTQILHTRPDWKIARKDAARAYLAWAKMHPEASTYWKTHVPGRREKTKVSAIVCSIRADYFVHIKSQLKARFSKYEIEVIGIHDAKSLCEGYNRGAAKAKGDVLIFCHDDIDIVHDDFADRLLHHLGSHDLVGVVGTSRLVSGDWGHAGLPHLHGQIIHRPKDDIAVKAGKMSSFIYLAVGLQSPVMEGIQALDGVFMATHRRVWEALKFDEKTFDGFHLYDIDFSYRAHLAGYKVAVPLDLLLVHFSTGRYDRAWQQFHLRFLEKFPRLPNRPNVRRYANLNVKLQTLEQVERMHRALLHHQFGILKPETRP
jgi:protein O-GlcNAc transferase